MATDLRPSRLARRAVRLEWLTIVWNTVESAVAVSAGIAAGSVALTGFGFDSAIETTAAVLVLRRLRRVDAADGDAGERRTLRAIAVSFVVLAGYVAIESTSTLARGERPSHSPVGIAVTTLSLVVMIALSRAKRRTGFALRNPLVVADAAETAVCSWLSATTLLGLAGNSIAGWWWLDPIAALVVGGFALREAREAWSGELFCDDDGADHDACH